MAAAAKKVREAQERAQEVIENQLKLYKIKRNFDVLELYLAKEGLTELPDLSDFKQLKYLWLNHNKIKHLNFLRTNSHLKELYLHNNLLTDITGALKHLKSLHILMLQNNWLTKVEQTITEFRNLRWMHTLNLFNNPLTQDHDYRLYAIYHLPSLQLLDRQEISQRERDAAFGLWNQDRLRVRQSLAFGQRMHDFIAHGLAQKKKIKNYPDNSKHASNALRFPTEDALHTRLRQRSVMQFSTLDWNQVPTSQQKRLADKPMSSSHIITTQFR
ncbi:leucine-rich repeat-containing protein 72 isoform X1 [Heptranchias perlo]|uniref:leucine-rich repeat-containing protein 72 isoform X1 n=1 Tax=Heptranchias perlo TaxID=212740 RepID=UPI00355AC522